MLRWLLPREDRFFTLLTRQAEKALDGIKAVREMLADYTNLESKVKAIHRLENEADSLCHSVHNTLDSTFVTPIDREDIHVLASSIDNVMDQIDAGARRMYLFKVKKPMPEMIQIVEVAERACAEMVKVIALLDRPGNSEEIRIHLEEINRLENEGDRINHAALARLFDEEKDAIKLIKLKEVMEFFERAVDSCEQVAHVVETIVVKNS